MVFIGNLLVGWLGGLLERMPATNFWLMHAGLIAAAALVLLVLRGAMGRVLAPAAAIGDAAVQGA